MQYFKYIKHIKCLDFKKTRHSGEKKCKKSNSRRVFCAALFGLTGAFITLKPVGPEAGTIKGPAFAGLQEEDGLLNGFPAVSPDHRKSSSQNISGSVSPVDFGSSSLDISGSVSPDHRKSSSQNIIGSVSPDHRKSSSSNEVPDTDAADIDDTINSASDDSWDEQTILERWHLESSDLPEEETDAIPAVPEELRSYFEEAVYSSVESLQGATPPVSDLRKYSLRADTIRAAARQKIRLLMKEESEAILGRMNSFSQSFREETIPALALELQSRTDSKKMTVFGKEQTGKEDSENKGPFLSIVHGTPDSQAVPETGLELETGAVDAAGTESVNGIGSDIGTAPETGTVFSENGSSGSDENGVSGFSENGASGSDENSASGFSENNSSDFTGEDLSEDPENDDREAPEDSAGDQETEADSDLTANFALANPLTSGDLYLKYGNKSAGDSNLESDEEGEVSEAEEAVEEDAEEDSSGDSSAPASTPRRIVYIGDSRTVGMEIYVGGDDNEYWSAKNSTGYSWMVSTGTPAVENLIGENTDVVILMGVNDLGNVSRYVEYMNAKAAEWKERGARTFFVSVTPVVDSKSPNAKNSRIESFNEYAINNLQNVHYIDAYSRIRNSFGSPDGIHFDAATYREIYRIIHFYLYQGWYEEAGLRFYFDCGRPVTGWHLLDGEWQYMDGAGVRWIKNSRVGDVCMAPHPVTGLLDPDVSILSETNQANFTTLFP